MSWAELAVNFEIVIGKALPRNPEKSRARHLRTYGDPAVPLLESSDNLYQKVVTMNNALRCLARLLGVPVVVWRQTRNVIIPDLPGKHRYKGLDRRPIMTKADETQQTIRTCLYMTVLLLKLMPLQQPSLQVLPKHVTRSNMHTQNCTLSSGKCRRLLQRRQPMLSRNIRSPKIMPKLVSTHVMLGHRPRVFPFLIPTCYMMWLRLVTVGLVGTAPAVLVLPMVVVSGRPNVLVIAVMLSFFVMDFLFVRNVVKL